MESTGIYWKPVYNILEEDFEVVLVNARHIKHVPGRKTDVCDSKWLCKLLRNGLVKGSFVPERDMRELRDLTRYRKKLVQAISSKKNRVQKILEDANIKLSSVVSDTFGVSGNEIREALEMGINNELPKGVRGQELSLIRDNGSQPTATSFMKDMANDENGKRRNPLAQ
ncbi:MAG: transposase [Candidatus Brocadiaceae bacterium]|nr:transposase [Candidatus Brocadiaceae bacterium]